MNAVTDAERTEPTNASQTPMPDDLLIEQLTQRGYTISKPQPKTAASKPLRKRLLQRVDWLKVGAFCFSAFFVCGAAVFLGGLLWFVGFMICSLIWNDDAFNLLSWHGAVALLVAAMLLPAMTLIGLAHLDGTHIAPAVGNPNSPLGHVLRKNGLAPPVPPSPSVALEKGRSQFATLPTVQQAGIWKP